MPRPRGGVFLSSRMSGVGNPKETLPKAFSAFQVVESGGRAMYEDSADNGIDYCTAEYKFRPVGHRSRCQSPAAGNVVTFD